jgi:prepilin-type N-terminal cleavage/methylation domain-containing protein/prepilin-type processing-associated H-X9-DG protein
MHQMQSNTALDCQGFTLVELLVVIGIVAVLVGLSLPVASNIRQASLQSSCANNLRQMAATIHAFAIDHRNKLPPRKDENDEYDSGKKQWYTLLNEKGYLSSLPPSNKTMYCPGGPKPTAISHGYGYRQWEGTKVRVDAAIPISTIENPAKFWLFADSVQPSGTGLRQWYTIQDAGVQYSGFHLRHREHVNVVFADGHVESLNRLQAIELASAEPQYTKKKLEVRAADGTSVY